MSKLTHLTQEIRDTIAERYRSKAVTQEILAQQYGTSSTTIRRILNAYGLVRFPSECTKKERDFLEVIKFYAIKDANQLRTLISKGIQC